MVRLLKRLLKAALPVFLLIPGLVSAGPAELNEAVQKYYAGHPEQALGLLEPVAMDGDVEAQYLMGNILYSLSKTEKYKNSGDPVKWYQMAADQGVADASYALGVIYQNSWNESRDGLHAALAITHFQKASAAGYAKATSPLNRLKAKTGMSIETAAKLARKADMAMMAKAEPAENKKVQEIVKQTEKKAKVIAKIEPVETVSEVETPVVETEKIEPAKVEQAKVEPAIEPEVVTESVQQPESVAALVESNDNIEVTLAELAGECSNYTQVGYNYYAESIKGASFTGIATITKSSKLNSSTRQISLVNDRFGVVVVISLKSVPKKVVSGLRVGQEMNISAIVEHSQIIGSSCAVDLSYRLVKS